MAFLDNDGVTRLTGDYLDIFARKEDAVLDPSGGLIRTNDGIRVDSLVQESDGEVSGAIAELTAKGHAEQFSTTGKNLFNFKAFKSVVSGYHATLAFDENGVTITSTDTGACTSNSSITGDARIAVTAGQTVVLSWKASNNNNGFVIIYGNNDSSKSVSVNNNAAKYLTYTVPDGVTFLTYRFGVTTIGDSIRYYDIQFELGSTATAYEPYTGGAPSPSPDYPQEIQVVRGRNLFNPNGIVVNGYINNGILITDSENRGIALPVEPNTTYTIRGQIVNTGTISDNWHIGEFSEIPVTNAQSLMTYVTSDTNKNQLLRTFTTTPNTKYLFIKYCNITRSNPEVTKQTIQLELGSEATPYVPYGHVGMEVQGKNLVNSTLEVVKSASAANIVWRGNTGTVYGITFTINDDGSVTANGTSTNTAQVALPIDIQETGSYFYSGCPSGGSSGKYDLYPWDLTTSARPKKVLDNTENAATDYGDGASCTFIKGHKNLISIRIYTNNTVSNLTFYPQVEAGTTRTPYEPYIGSITPIPLPSRGWVAGLPDGTADELHLDGAGKVTWNKQTDEVVLDGTGYTYNAIYKTTYCHVVLDGLSAKYTLCTALSDELINYGAFIASPDTDMEVIGFATNGSLRFNLKLSRLTNNSVEAIIAYLSTHPITVLYPLATPITEDAGYVDMPAIPSDATVTIPELDALGIKYFVDDSVTGYGREIIERGQYDLSETNKEIDTLEASIASVESVVAMSNHAVGDYFMLGNVLMRTTTAIASGEKITASNATPATMQSQIDALRDSVALKTKTITATTGTMGAFSLGLNLQHSEVLGVFIPNYRCITVVSSDANLFGVVIAVGLDITAVANVEITATVYYRDR